MTGLVALGGLIFGCGLPGWAIVRWVFNFIARNRDAGIDAVAKEARGRRPHGTSVSCAVCSPPSTWLTIVRMLVTGLVLALLVGAFVKLKVFGGGQ